MQVLSFQAALTCQSLEAERVTPSCVRLVLTANVTVVEASFDCWTRKGMIYVETADNRELCSQNFSVSPRNPEEPRISVGSPLAR